MQKQPSHRLIAAVGLILCAAVICALFWCLHAPASQESASLGTPFPDSFDPSNVADSYTISTLDQLLSFAEASHSFNFSGVTIHLTADIGYTGASFPGIGTADYPFCGTFHGNGHTIWDLYSTSSGLFLAIGSTDSPATIRDLTLDNAQISGGEGRAILVCRFNGNALDPSANSRILNVTVSNSTASFSGGNCGILAGRCLSDGQAITIQGCTISNCQLICTASSATNLARWGMVLGKDVSQGYTRITDCTVFGSQIISNDCNLDQTGLILGGGFSALQIQDCQVQASSITCGLSSATPTQDLGGIVGSLKSSQGVIRDCLVSSTAIETRGLSQHIGLIAGHLYGGTVEDSHTEQSRITATYAGGSDQSTQLGSLIGQISSSTATVRGCSTKRVILSTADRASDVGGLIGSIAEGCPGVTVSDCCAANSYLTSTYTSADTALSRWGGLIGSTAGPLTVNGTTVVNVNVETASLMDAFGGMIGSVEASATGAVIANSHVSMVSISGKCASNCTYSTALGGAVGRSLSKLHATDVTVTDTTMTLGTLIQGLGGFSGYLSGTAPSVLTDCHVERFTANEAHAPLDDDYMSYHLSTFLGCVDSDSTIAACSVTDSSVTSQGRMLYLGGLIASTYSDTISATPTHGQITVKNSWVTGCALTTKQSRNCNESGGLVGWLSEGSTVTDCCVSGFTSPSNTNSGHVGGLIGYIPESTTENVSTTVKDCFVHDCTLSGKNSLSATIGNAVASGEVFQNNHYHNCTLTGGTESGSSGASEATSGLTDGTLVATLNAGSDDWLQGATAPELDPDKDPHSTVTVMTYNIYYLTQNDSYPIADRQAKVIDLIDSCCQQGVGVIGLQEVTKIWNDDIADYVKTQNTALSWCGYGRYGGTFGGFAGGTNDAGDAFSLILFDTTKYTKVSEGHFWLSDTPDEKSAFYTVASNYRVVNWVQLRDKQTGEAFFFVNAHLEETQSTAITNHWGYTVDSSSGPTARVQQAQLICDRMASVSGGLPVIILGDWNSYAGTDGYSTIIDSGYQDLRLIAPDAHHCGAYNAWERTDPQRFAKGDHIVVSEGCIATTCHVLYLEDLDAATGYHLSDHCPMIAQIRY